MLNLALFEESASCLQIRNDVLVSILQILTLEVGGDINEEAIVIN